MARWLVVIALLGACGGDDGASTCDVPAAGTLGGACDDGSGCADLGSCNRRFAGGYCTGASCELDDDCGEGAVCGTVDAFGERECLLACSGPAEACECPTGMMCSPTLLGYNLRARACVPGNPDATDGSPCQSAADCHNGDYCWRDELQAPGGVCMRWFCGTCAPNGDGVCAPSLYFDTNLTLDGDNCVDTCEVDGDCRQAEGYRCLDAPPAAIGLICRSTWIGDACAADADCGAAPWRCETAGFPGGYCTIACVDDGDCPTDAACDETLAAPICRRHCFDADDECRDGYECGTADGSGTCVPVPP